MNGLERRYVDNVAIGRLKVETLQLITSKEEPIKKLYYHLEGSATR